MKKIIFVLFVVLLVACGSKDKPSTKSDAEAMTVDTSQTQDATAITDDSTPVTVVSTTDSTDVKTERSSNSQRGYFLHEVFQLYSQNFFETSNPMAVDALKRTVKALEADCTIVCPNDLKQILGRMKDLIKQKDVAVNPTP